MATRDDAAPTGRSPAGTLAAAAVRLAALWVLAGAVFKLGWGTPALLPEVVLDTGRSLGLPAGATYRAVTGIELAIGLPALLAPRLAWPFVVLVYLVFEAVLAGQIAAGDEACGCFGEAFTIDPKVMAAIDGALLLALLAARPWRGAGRGAPPLLALLAAAGGLALPWVLDREVDAPPESGEPRLGRGFVDLDIEGTVGRSIYETKLAKWLEEDPYELPGDGLWVLWRWDCEHCARHFEELASDPPAVPFLVLVRVKQPTDTEGNRAVFVMPEGPNVLQASLREDTVYPVTTPAELRVEGGVVVEAREGVGSK